MPYGDTYDQALFICPFVFALSFVFLADKLHIPNQLLAMVYGTAIGCAYVYIPGLQKLENYFWSPDNILVLCHPIMVSKVAYNLDGYVFMKSIYQILILCIFGTGMFIFTFGFLIIVVTERTINLVNIVAAGTTLASIDVPEVLMELNRIKNLEVIMDGESILGTALCIITFTICMGHYDGYITEWYHVFYIYLRFISLAIIVGVIVGKSIGSIFHMFYQDSYNAVTAVLATCYLAYFVCETFLYCSGAICTFTIGYFIAKERTKLSPAVDAKVLLVLDNAYNIVELLNCIVLSCYVTCRMVKIYKGFDVAVAVSVYLMGNVLRVLILILLSPILSRLGLGLNFTALFTIFWAAKRGSLQLLQVIYIAHHKLTEILGTELLCFTLVYLILSFLINMTSLSFILKYFGLIEFTIARKYNITECINTLLTTKQRVMFTLKTNRRFSDVNWELVNKATTLQNPYANVDATQFERVSEEFETICPLCSKTIPYVNSAKKAQGLMRNVKTKVLKRQRISLVRQFEMGILSRKDLETILQNIEMALITNNINLNVEYCKKLFEKDATAEKWKKCLEKYKLSDVPIELRKNRITKYFKFINSSWLLYVKLFIVITVLIFIFSWLMLSWLNHEHASIILWIGYYINVILLLEIVAKLCIYSRSYLKMIFSMKSFSSSFWICLDIFLCILDISAFIASLCDYNKLRPYCLIRFIYIIQIVVALIPLLIKNANSRIDKKVNFAYTTGLAIVLSLEDVQMKLHTICKLPNVNEVIAHQLQMSKLALVELLASVQQERPWVPLGICTYQIKNAILKSMTNTLNEVKHAGLLEDFEHKKLRQVIESEVKNTRWMTSMRSVTARAMLQEVPWMGTDEELFDFIFTNSIMRIWQPGDVICHQGDYLDGVYLILEGLFKMTYDPNEDILNDLHIKGCLPVKDLLSNTVLTESEVEYLIVGNTIGEFSFLTGRPYSCRIEVLRSSTILVISKSVLEKAALFNTDPIYGLLCRIWKSVASKILWRMLTKHAQYYNIGVYAQHLLVNRAFLPDISNYKVLQVSNYIDDIFLIDGFVIDNKSREIYTAPCHIPRSIRHLLLPPEEDLVKPKLVIIPHKSIDSYTIMRATEKMSQLIKDPIDSAMINNTIIRRIIREEVIKSLEDYDSTVDIEMKSEKIVEEMTRKSINEAKTSSIWHYMSEKF